MIDIATQSPSITAYDIRRQLNHDVKEVVTELNRKALEQLDKLPRWHIRIQTWEMSHPEPIHRNAYADHPILNAVDEEDAVRTWHFLTGANSGDYRVVDAVPA